MANRTNSLVISARIDGLGWRRGSILNSKNGRVKDGYMIYNGVEYPTIKASYQIRSYNSEGKAVDTGVGTDLEKAQATLSRLNDTKTYQAAADKLGIIPDKKDASTMATYRTSFLIKYARGTNSNVLLSTRENSDSGKV